MLDGLLHITDCRGIMHYVCTYDGKKQEDIYILKVANCGHCS